MFGVAYIVHAFDMGGLERCVAHLANHLDQSRFRPLIVCLCRNGTAAEWITRDDIPIVEIKKKPRNDFGAVRRLAGVLKEHQVDVVHSHNWGTLIETSIARRLAAVRCHVHTEHGQGLHADLRGLKRRLRGWATRWAFNRADTVVVCAESVRPLIEARCRFPESRIKFVPNGVDQPPETAGHRFDIAEVRHRFGISDEAVIVGSVGRLVSVKDFGTAIDSVALLFQRGHDVHLVLVGDGPEEEQLKTLARKAQIPGRVHFPGRQENIGDWLGLCDLYVNSSRSEAMSMGILEAMSAGLPVVATNVGDNAALINGEAPCGLAVPAGDPRSLANSLEELITEPDLRQMMAERARERYLARYSTGHMVDAYSRLYSSHLPTSAPVGCTR